MPYSVYAIRLDKEIYKNARFARANPLYDPRKPCLYIGSTALTPEQRYENHLTKKSGSKWVKEFGDGLYLAKTDKQPKHTNRRDAEFAEFIFAMRLRRRGYGIWTNLPPVPSFYKETLFLADEWKDAPDKFAIITAYATTGENWSDKENKDADRRLMKTLRSYKVWMTRITGYSPSSGHSEPGWAVDIDLENSCNLGNWFKQDAIYYVKNDKLFVSYCDSRRALVPVGSFSDRLNA